MKVSTSCPTPPCRWSAMTRAHFLASVTLWSGPVTYMPPSFHTPTGSCLQSYPFSSSSPSRSPQWAKPGTMVQRPHPPTHVPVPCTGHERLDSCFLPRFFHGSDFRKEAPWGESAGPQHRITFSESLKELSKKKCNCEFLNVDLLESTLKHFNI